jgi:hypothetical protein
MAINAPQAVRELLSYTVITDKESLIKLLERNGVSLPSDASDYDVNVAVLLASSKSPNFKNELAKLLTSKVGEAGDVFLNLVGSDADFGFTGVDDLGFTGSDNFFAANGFASPFASMQLGSAVKTAQAQQVADPKKKSGVGNVIAGIGRFFKENVLTSENINTGLQLGLTTINNKVQQKQNAVQTEALILQQQQDVMRQQVAQKQGISGTTIVIGLVGVAILGTIMYVMTKKK